MVTCTDGAARLTFSCDFRINGAVEIVVLPSWEAW